MLFAVFFKRVDELFFQAGVVKVFYCQNSTPNIWNSVWTKLVFDPMK